MKKLYWIIIIAVATILIGVIAYLVATRRKEDEFVASVAENLRRGLTRGVAGVDYPAPQGYWDTHGCTGKIVNDMCPPPSYVTDKIQSA